MTPKPKRILSKNEMDIQLIGGCSNPDCDCSDKPMSEMFICQNCHPEADLQALYQKTGVLQLLCAVCDQLVVAVELK